jgi:hypothetical protein
MVNRVYLTGSIVDLRRTADSQKGSLLALWPFGSSSSASQVPVAVPVSAPSPSPSPAPGNGAADQIQALTDRLAKLEQKLSNVKNGGALSHESFFGNESSLEGKFERPVAIGYRSVRYESPVKPSKPSQ